MKGTLRRILSFKAMIVLSAFILTACGSGGEDGGGKVALTLNGTWNGTATSDNGGSLNITLVLSQIGSNISGHIDCSARDTLQCPGTGGTASGTFTANNLTMNIEWENGNACNQFDGTLEGGTLKGRYSCQEFGGVSNFTDTGNWTATLQ